MIKERFQLIAGILLNQTNPYPHSSHNLTDVIKMIRFQLTGKGSFTYYVITEGEGGFGMITLM